jgi:hypothetical protein
MIFFPNLFRFREKPCDEQKSAFGRRKDCIVLAFSGVSHPTGVKPPRAGAKARPIYGVDH